MYNNIANPHHYIKSRFWKHWALSLAAFIILAFIMTRIPFFAVDNLLAIEFAPNAQAFNALITDVELVRRNTYIDFGFMLAYTAMFYFSGRVLYDLLQFTTRKLLFVLLLPFLFDAVENLLLLQMLGKAPEDYLSFWTFYYAVRLKWFFVVPGSIVSLMVLLFEVYVGLDRLKAKN